MRPITYLGPEGTTFSHAAYHALADRFNMPHEGILRLAASNEDIVTLVSGYGGYGAAAAETTAGGRVSEFIESLACQLDDFNAGQRPFIIRGGLRMRIRFQLAGLAKTKPIRNDTVFGHKQALVACAKSITELGLVPVEMPSNGAAMERIASMKDPRAFALGPEIGVRHYGLTTMREDFQDREAATTFLALAPAGEEDAVPDGCNRALIACELRHEPGAMVKALTPLHVAGFNLLQVHSFPVGDGRYRFVFEVDVPGHRVCDYGTAEDAVLEHTTRHIAFGPYPIFSET